MKRMLVFFLVFVFCLSSCSDVYMYTTGNFFSMSTSVTVISNVSTDFADIMSYAEDFENRVSRTRVGSDIFALNTDASADLSDDTLYILKTALEIAKDTNGAFNPCMGVLSDLWDITSGKNIVPEKEQIEKALDKINFDTVLIDGNKVKVGDGTKIDLGGVAKGYALEKMLEIETAGEKDANTCISVGGNVGVIGSSESNRKKNIDGWNVGITNPFDNSEILGTLLLSDGFVSVSGAYERFFEKDGKIYHHIFDTKTGYPSDSDLASAAVVCNDGLVGDALSTALFVMGEQEAVEFYKKGIYDFDMILVLKDGSVLISEGLSEKFSLETTAKKINCEKMTIITTD